MAFDPDAYLAEKKFDPDAYLAKGKEPSIAKVGAGLASEIAVGEGAKIAGALTAGPIGYAIGAVVGGVAGSLAAQEIEGRDKISWGRVAADTALNLIPGGLGKAKKGVGVLPRLAEEGTKRAAGGALISATGAQIEKAVEDREFLTQDELTNALAVGGALGLGLGAAGEVMKKAYPKFEGKGADLLNDAYEKGDPDATAIVEGLAGTNPVGRGSRLKRMIFERVYPSKLTGKDVSLDIHRAKNESEAALDLASTLRSRIDNLTKDATEADVLKLDDYIANLSDELPKKFQPIKKDLDFARDQVEEYQNTLLSLYKSGDLEMNEITYQKIKDSVESRNYFTREYRFYEDSNYQPSVASENKLKASLMKDRIVDGKRVKAMTSDQASEYIQGLKDSRNDSMGLLNKVYGNKRVLKRQRDLSDEMKEFLGEYTGAGEKMFGTISRLGRLASQESANKRVVDNLTNLGIAQKFDPLKVPEDFRPLTIRGKSYDSYVPQYVNKALDDLHSTGLVRDSGPWVDNVLTKLLSSTTAAAKFARVPLNLASYPPQLFGNATLTAAQGINPFKFFGKGAKVALNEALPQRYKLKTLPLSEVNRLKELGIVNKGVTASDIRDGFKNGIPMKAFDKAAKGFGNAYNFFDTAQRIVVYENYRKFLKDIIPSSDVQRLGKEFDQLAADLTNDTYMNYDRISTPLRRLSRYAILNEFGAFNFELARITWNQAKLAKSMLDGTFAARMNDKYGIQFDPATLSKIKEQGAYRVGALGSIIGAGVATPFILNRQDGIDSEKDAALRESVLAPWETDQSLHIRRDGNKITAANLSYQLPMSELSSIAESAFRGENIVDSAGKMFDALWGKYGGDLTINMKNIFAARNNMDLRGRRISDRPEGSLGRLFDLAGWYFADTFTPGTVSDLRKLDERETIDNVLRYTLGYRSRNFDLLDGAGFKFRDINKNLQNIRSKYTGDTYGKKNLESAYNERNAVYKQNLEQAIRHVNNLRTLEIEDSEIEKLLKKTFSKAQVSNIMQGVAADMPISANVRIEDRVERVKRYVEISEKLPRRMVLEMLQEDFDNKKIKRSDVRNILNSLNLQQGLGQ